MTCNKKLNLENGWNRYCSFINKLPGIKNDTVRGVYLGCICKKHDILYSTDGEIKDRSEVDLIFAREIEKEFLKKGKSKTEALIVALSMFVGVRAFGMFYWKTWSAKGVQRYK